MTIAKLHYISEGNTPKIHLENIQKACTAGIELIQLGFSDISDKKMLKIAEEAREITAHYQTRLVLTNNYKIAKEIKADGVYLEKTDLCPTIARKKLFTWQMIGGSANTLEQCQTLIRKEIDYIGLGPFKNIVAEASLSLDDYISIIKTLETETPIIGFGNITLEKVPNILKTGISGLAISDGITLDFDAIKAFNQLLKASSTEEQRHTFQ